MSSPSDRTVKMSETPHDIQALAERAKELRCLYAVEAVISNRRQTPVEAFAAVLREIPAGWQRPSTVGACIEYLGRRHVGSGFEDRGRTLTQPLCLWDVPVGRVLVSDSSPLAMAESEPFLVEEAELLRRIAARLGEYLEWKHTELLSEAGRGGPKDHWGWRERFARALVDRLDPARFGVSRVFLGGSTARGDAGPASDIDLYVVFEGSPTQRENLAAWLEGWSLCLGEVALQQTGQPFGSGILNVQWLERVPDARQRLELRELALRRGRA